MQVAAPGTLLERLVASGACVYCSCTVCMVCSTVASAPDTCCTLDTAPHSIDGPSVATQVDEQQQSWSSCVQASQKQKSSKYHCFQRASPQVQTPFSRSRQPCSMPAPPLQPAAARRLAARAAAHGRRSSVNYCVLQPRGVLMVGSNSSSSKAGKQQQCPLWHVSL